MVGERRGNAYNAQSIKNRFPQKNFRPYQETSEGDSRRMKTKASSQLMTMTQQFLLSSAGQKRFSLKTGVHQAHSGLCQSHLAPAPRGSACAGRRNSPIYPSVAPPVFLIWTPMGLTQAPVPCHHQDTYIPCGSPQCPPGQLAREPLLRHPSTSSL